MFDCSVKTFIVPIQDGVVPLGVTPRPMIIILLVSKLCYTQNINRRIRVIENIFHLKSVKLAIVVLSFPNNNTNTVGPIVIASNCSNLKSLVLDQYAFKTIQIIAHMHICTVVTYNSSGIRIELCSSCSLCSFINIKDCSICI